MPAGNVGSNFLIHDRPIHTNDHSEGQTPNLLLPSKWLNKNKVKKNDVNDALLPQKWPDDSDQSFHVNHDGHYFYIHSQCFLNVCRMIYDLRHVK